VVEHSDIDRLPAAVPQAPVQVRTGDVRIRAGNPGVAEAERAQDPAFDFSGIGAPVTRSTSPSRR
jgi:hypothetical protein